MRHRFFLASLAFLFCTTLALGQADPRSNVYLGGDHPKKEKTPTSRSVKGMVTDESGRPLDNALVTLTNDDSHERLTFFTKKDGRYNFDGLSFTTDYRVAAIYKSNKSVEKTLSQYDHQVNVVRILPIEGVGVPEKTPPVTAQK